MPLARLLDTLRCDVDREVESILDAARTEAARIAAEADAAIERGTEALLAAAVREHSAASLHRAVKARRDARARVLGARRALLDAVFARADAALRKRTVDDDVCVAMAREALGCIPPVPATLRCAPRYAPALRAAVAGASVRVTADEAMSAGVVLRADDGSVEVDHTVSAALARVRPALEIELATRLDEAR